jgi:hypothetical protein
MLAKRSTADAPLRCVQALRRFGDIELIRAAERGVAIDLRGKTTSLGRLGADTLEGEGLLEDVP